MVWLCSFHTINSNQHLDTYSIASQYIHYSPSASVQTMQTWITLIQMPTTSSSLNKLSHTIRGWIILSFVLRESGIPHFSRPFWLTSERVAFKYQTFYSIFRLQLCWAHNLFLLCPNILYGIMTRFRNTFIFLLWRIFILFLEDLFFSCII